MLLKVVGKAEPFQGTRLVQTCPHCRAKAFLELVGNDIRVGGRYSCGQRMCPSCRGHVFVVTEGDRIVEAYPPFRIDFDASDIPERIVKTLTEALDCHGHNYHIAAAIMVRRTLEEICDNLQAKGKDLKDRIRDLKGRVILPPELFAAMDELRLLGNDAAHIEAKTFEDIGAEELQTAIEFTKEILKGVYQYKGLLTKLQALKKKTAPTPAPPAGGKP